MSDAQVWFILAGGFAILLGVLFVIGAVVGSKLPRSPWYPSSGHPERRDG